MSTADRQPLLPILLATALGSSLLTLSIHYLFHRLSPLPSLFNGASVVCRREGEEEGGREWDEGLIREQLSRNYLFLSEQSMARIRSSRVIVVGCGGVGSAAAVMLLRSGVQRLKLIDFDQVTLSSLNRHASATLEDVGTPKVHALKRYLLKIAPWAEIEACAEMYTDPDAPRLLSGHPNWVLDAIDNVGTKVGLMHYCKSNGLKIFSSMGAGAKADPSRVQIADISNTQEDPLARVVRQKLRLRGISSGIPVVYSTEQPCEVKLMPLPDDEFERGKVSQLAAFDDFRVRLLPVLGPLPSIFGQVASTYIILDLAQRAVEPLAIQGKHKLSDRQWRELRTREGRRHGDFMNYSLPFSVWELALIIDDVYRCHSVVAPHAWLSGVYAVRWDPSQPLALDNIVCMSRTECEAHEKSVFGEGKTPVEVWGQKSQDYFEHRRQIVRRLLDSLNG